VLLFVGFFFIFLLPASLCLFNQLLLTVDYLIISRGKGWYAQGSQMTLVLHEAGNIFIYT